MFSLCNLESKWNSESSAKRSLEGMKAVLMNTYFYRLRASPATANRRNKYEIDAYYIKTLIVVHTAYPVDGEINSHAV
jgi:hypothetical protein